MTPSTRFDVLQRDGFACGYCGARAPEARLQVDHIVPRSAGGSDATSNLITACVTCNQGKGKRQLGPAPVVLRTSPTFGRAGRRSFSPSEIKIIREFHESGIGISQLARQHHCAKSVMWCIVHGRTYKDVAP